MTYMAMLQIPQCVKECLFRQRSNNGATSGIVESEEEKRPMHQLKDAIVTSAAVLLPLGACYVGNVGELDGWRKMFSERFGLALEFGHNWNEFLDAGRGFIVVFGVDVLGDHLIDVIGDAPKSDFRQEEVPAIFFVGRPLI